MKTTHNPLKKEIDLQHEAIAILKTLLLLEKHYSGAYISKILTGENPFGWRHDSHPEFETFGKLNGYYRSQIEDFIFYLISLSFVNVQDEVFGTLEISQLGEAYLSQPRELRVTKEKLFKPWYEIELTKQIRSWRMALASEFFKKPYQIFTNFTLFQLTKRLPGNLLELSQVKGLEKLNEEERLDLLKIIEEMVHKKKIDDETGVYRKAYAPSKRKVKELFEAGLSLEEIANRRKLKVSTARNYLEILHKAEEINLLPWIEERMDSLVLHKVNQYFHSAEDKSLKVAQKVLELDYETLALGRLYAEGRTPKPV